MEREFLEWVAKSLPSGPLLEVGIGDDAAVLHWPGDGNLVVATDAVTDQVDFRLADIDPALAGRKALAVNLSDLAAMAARPVAAFVSLVLPRGGVGKQSAGPLAEDLMRGVAELAADFNVLIAGGDTNTWDAPLAISVTVIGQTAPPGPLTRSGAQVGDAVLVTGQLGGSILGRHLTFSPRVPEAICLHQRHQLHAGMDVSDGLAIDASRLAAASDAGVVLWPHRIPVSDDAKRLASESGRPALDHALTDGEDFELLVTAAAGDAQRLIEEQPLDVPVTQIGVVVAETGLWQEDAAGIRSPLNPAGYLHQAD